MKVYVGTYGKYNAGSIGGAWLDLEDYADKEEFYGACADLHKDEHDPEFMFQDWEDIPKGMISECHIDAEVWELLEAFEEHDEDAVKAYLSLFGKWDADDFQDRYRGQYKDWEDFAYELLEETGEINEIPERLRNYFDYAAYARDLHYDFCEEDGHFFWNN